MCRSDRPLTSRRGLVPVLMAVALAFAPVGGAMAQDALVRPTADVKVAQVMPFTGTQSIGNAGPFTAPPSILAPGATRPGQPAPQVGSARDPHTQLPQPPAGKAALGASARFSTDGGLIPRGLVWRIFAATPEASGAFPLVAETVEPTPVFFLSPGSYVLYVSYGLASAAQRITVGTASLREQLVVPAGGLRLLSDVNDKPIPSQKVNFDIYEGSFLQGRTSSRPYFRGAASGDLVVLPEGAYYVVSNYGDGNATIQVDLNIQAGKMTEATIHHRAAQITLKLVQQAGSEAMPDTQWSVLTTGGDTIKESIGAFPDFVLAEGGYVAMARHDGKVYTQEFTVESGKDRDVEVEAKNAQAK